MHLKSKDVVHSFYLPNFRVKQDALPGVETRAWFAAKIPGSLRDRLRAALRRQPLPDARPRSPSRASTAFDAWMRAAADVARKRYDPDDVDAHWGWPWS